MSAPQAVGDVREVMRGRLVEARRAVHRAQCRAALGELASASGGRLVKLAAVLLGAAAVGYLLSVTGVLSTASAGRWGQFLWVLLIGGLVAEAAWTVAAARRRMRPPSWPEVAERLDLAVADHNRIATAMNLLEMTAWDGSPLTRRRDDVVPCGTGVSPVVLSRALHLAASQGFADAAIADGLTALDRYHHNTPRLPEGASHSAWTSWLLAVVLIVAAGWIWWGGVTTGSPGPGPLADDDAASQVLPGPATGGELPADQSAGGPRRQAEPAAAVGPSSAPAPSGPVPPLNQPQEGQSGMGSGGTARNADRPEGAGGQAAQASASAVPDTRPQPQSPPRAADRPRTANKPDARTAQQEAGLNAGGAGRGQASAVQHDWDQKVQAAAGNDEPDEDDDTAEDEPESNRQRGGIQPSLKDRRASPTRELGISGEQGPPGTGRGGPTAPKKSRGTASLVLGVPIPDFVRGRQGPGTSRVIRQRIQPVPMPGEPAAAIDAADRQGPEAPLLDWPIPPADQEAVRDYLIGLHAGDEREKTELGSEK